MLGQLSIRTKTILVAMVSSVLMLLIATSIGLYYQQTNQRKQLTEELEVISRIIADRSTAALQFNDTALASQNLGAAAQRGAIEAACLYDVNDKLFASYQRRGAEVNCDDYLPGVGEHLGAGIIQKVHSVELDQSTIGTLFLYASLDDLKHFFWLQVLINVVAAFLAAMVSIMLASRMQARVTEPIKWLKSTARDVGDTNNYSLRATKISHDELGELTDSFNDMLDQIETNNKALKESEERFRLLTTASPVGVYQTDASGQLLFVNEQWREITGIQGEHPDHEHWVLALHPADRDRVINETEQAFRERAECRIEHRLNKPLNHVVHVVNHARPLFFEGERFQGYIGTLLDITELKHVQTQLKQLALFDPLTQLANRHLFRNRLVKALQLQHRTHEKFAVLFLDVDHFKRINDTLGHDQGDALLCELGNRLQACTRPTDTVARLGGDEFTLLISGLHINQEAERVARKILELLKTPMKLASSEVTISTSIGITIAPDDGEDANTLMKNADLAMYRAKQRGRNNYQFFSPEMNAALEQQMRQEEDLRNALKNDEFTLHFQPQVCIHSSRVVGYEALLRRMHPSQGVIVAEEFINAAEESGLIVPIGEWSIQSACEAIAEMNKCGLLDPTGHVAVNISPRQFRNPQLLDSLKIALESTGIPPHQLELEITETVVMDNNHGGLGILQALSKIGIQLTIDDFGTGYSSLNALKRLPIRSIKIDKSFMGDGLLDEEDKEITSAVIAMAHKIGLRVVAEGVEAATQVDFLRANDCDIMQGYFLGEPRSLTSLLASHEDASTAS